MTEFFLRFTADADRDLQRGYSLQYLNGNEDEFNALKARGERVAYLDDVEDYVWFHKGLSGHHINAATLEEAIEIVESAPAGRYFGDPAKDSWAIFEGYDACDLPGAQTWEGHDFTPVSVAHFQPARGHNSSL